MALRGVRPEGSLRRIDRKVPPGHRHAASSSQLAVSARQPGSRFPGPASGACFRFADSPWSWPFPPRTPPGLAPLCSPASTVLWPRPTSALRSPQASISFPSRPRHDCRRRVKTSQVPVEGAHTCLGSQTPRSSPRTLPCHGAGDVAFEGLERLGASDYLAFGPQYPCPHVPLPTLYPRPHGRRCTARGGTWLPTPFVSRDFHPLPFDHVAWHSKCRRILQSGATVFEHQGVRVASGPRRRCAVYSPTPADLEAIDLALSGYGQESKPEEDSA